MLQSQSPSFSIPVSWMPVNWELASWKDQRTGLGRSSKLRIHRIPSRCRQWFPRCCCCFSPRLGTRNWALWDSSSWLPLTKVLTRSWLMAFSVYSLLSDSLACLAIYKSVLDKLSPQTGLYKQASYYIITKRWKISIFLTKFHYWIIISLSAAIISIPFLPPMA